MDEDCVARGFETIGAWIMGRNMFGPIRGPWLDHPGGAGGAMTHRSIPLYSYSPTILGPR